MTTGPAMTQEEYLLLSEWLVRQMGIHFPEHRRVILESRLRPRLQALRLQSFMEYYLALQYDAGGERRRMGSVVTNNETYFFRETQQFEALFEEGIPQLRQREPDMPVLRLLSAACSSGEEPYTLNIYARQNQYRFWNTRVEIEAFDIDEERLAIAANGEYGNGSMRMLAQEDLDRYFHRVNGGRFKIKPMYQQGVRFSHGNLVNMESYPAPPGYHAVFCRNALIYFSEASILRVLDNFARVLRPGGFLFLGHSESIIGLDRRFEAVRLGRQIVYRRIAQ